MAYLYLILSILLPPCEYEDSLNCHWDGQSYGNKRGDRYVTLHDDTVPYPLTVVLYWDGMVKTYD